MAITAPSIRRASMLVLLALVLPLLLLPATGSRAAPDLSPRDCVAALPMSAAVPGLTGTGWTVARGRTPTSFRTEVIGVLRDAIVPGRHLIIAEVSGPVIDSAGGVWAGMSGSPVYVDHRGSQRLLGAVAYGFTWSASPVVGLTPGADLLALLESDQPVTPAEHPDAVELDDQIRLAIADQLGVTPAQVQSELTRLQVPLSVSGITSQRLGLVRERAEAAGLGVLPHTGSSRAASSTAPTARLRPGENLAATVSYGDVTVAAIGTVTATCRDRAVGFGHTLFGLPAGDVSLGANQAEALTVISDALGGPFKLATVGQRAGSMLSDRFAGARLGMGGVLETVPVTATVTDLTTGRSRTGRTDAVYVDWLPDVVLMHVTATVDTVADRVGAGNASTVMELRGRRADGTPWRVSRTDRFASDWDIASELSWAVFGDLMTLLNNPFEEVTVTGVTLRSGVDDDPPAVATIGEVRVQQDDGSFEPVDPAGGVIQTAGKLLRVEVDLRTFRQPPTTVRFAIPVPVDVEGFGTAEVRGGPVYRDPWECLWNPDACTEDEEAGLAGMLAEIAGRARNDELVGVISLYPGGEEPPLPPDDEVDGMGAPELAEESTDPEAVTRETSRLQLDRVVRGSGSFPVMIEPGRAPDTSTACPPDDVGVAPFTDVVGTIHETTISCLYGRGIVRGVTASRFAPREAVRRDQLASFLAHTLEAAGAPLPDAPAAGFSDTAGNVHAPAIDALVAAGILQGTTRTTFSPGQPVTRAQVATAVVRAAEYALGFPLWGEDEWFLDIEGSVHRDAINAAAEAALVVGTRPGLYAPSDGVQRAQVSAVLARLLDRLLVGEHGPEEPDAEGVG